jgi:hypothetical protein
VVNSKVYRASFGLGAVADADADVSERSLRASSTNAESVYNEIWEERVWIEKLLVGTRGETAPLIPSQLDVPTLD